jgi:hypothetical protein
LGLRSRPAPPVSAVSGRTPALEGRNPAGLQAAQAAQVVGGRLPVELQGGAGQADAAQHVAAHLPHAREDVLDPRPGPGNAGVAPLLARRQRPALGGLALDVHPPARRLEPLLALAVDVALVAVEVAAGVVRVEHVLQVQRVVLAGGADLDFADQLVAAVGAGGELVAEMGLAVLLGPGGVHVLLAALGGLPVGGHGALPDQFLLLRPVVLDRRGDEGGVDDLPAAGKVALLGELLADGVKDGLGSAGGGEPLAEGPDRGAVGYLAAAAQPGETLEAQPVQQLVFHLLVAEAVKLLQHQHPHHQFGRERRPAAPAPARARGGAVDRGGQGVEVNVLFHQLQHVAELVQLGFALLGGKQAFFDHGGSNRVGW